MNAELHLHCDFESRSLLNLKEVGLDNYSRHWSTTPTMMGYALGDDEVQLWLLGQPLPWAIAEHVYSGGLVYAHNMSFEWIIWNRICAPRFKWPELKAEQVRCTMAMCYAMSLPGKLEEAAPALGIEQRKDATGHRIMLQTCAPRHVYAPGEPFKNRKIPSRYETLPDGRVAEWYDSPEKDAAVQAYCRRDVVVERELAKRLMPLSDFEQKVWALDAKINLRGIGVDVPAAKGALTVIDSEKRRLDGLMAHATGGMVQACSNVDVLTDFLRFMGVETGGIAKADVVELLDRKDLPQSVRTALELRQEAAKTSLAKIGKMLSLVGEGDRLRYTKAYHAASTGRWGGRGVQPDNFPRGWMKNIQKDPSVADRILRKLAEGGDATGYISMLYGPPMDVLVNCLRAFLVSAPGCDLIADDFSNIESRVLDWLAGEEWELDVFRKADAGEGPGVYEVCYARSFNVSPESVDSEQRQVGKVQTLACGFGGGVGAFQAMAKIYNVKVSDKDASRFKELWRDAHPAIAGVADTHGYRKGGYWAGLESAAKAAVLNPGQKYMAGAPGREIIYKVAGSFLWCRLPSGRVITYAYPKIQPVTTKWGTKDSITFMTVPGDRPQDKARILPDPHNRSRWARMSTYGGSLAENVTQAVARDLLAEAIVRVEARGWPVVFHVHDEICVEVPSDSPPETLHLVEEEMGRLPSWAAGLPIESKGWRGRRYRKG